MEPLCFVPLILDHTKIVTYLSPLYIMTGHIWGPNVPHVIFVWFSSSSSLLLHPFPSLKNPPWKQARGCEFLQESRSVKLEDA